MNNKIYDFKIGDKVRLNQEHQEKEPTIRDSVLTITHFDDNLMNNVTIAYFEETSSCFFLKKLEKVRKFKIGQKVRINEKVYELDVSNFREKTIGMTGAIRECNDGGYRVYVKEVNDWYCYPEKCLDEIKEETSELKVGDKVRIVSSDSSNTKSYIGKIGVIEVVNIDYKVSFKDNWWWYTKDHLEKVSQDSEIEGLKKEMPEKVEEYEIGTKVRILQFDANNLASDRVGQIGEITENDRESSLYQYRVDFKDDYFFYKHDQVELASKNLKIGDKVKVLSHSGRFEKYDSYADIGEIGEVRKFRDYGYDIRFSYGNHWYYKFEELELIEEAKQKEEVEKIQYCVRAKDVHDIYRDWWLTKALIGYGKASAYWKHLCYQYLFDSIEEAQEVIDNHQDIKDFSNVRIEQFILNSENINKSTSIPLEENKQEVQKVSQEEEKPIENPDDRYSVGDKVKITNIRTARRAGSYAANRLGTVGEIQRVFNDSTEDYQIDFGDDYWFYHHDEVELVKEDTKEVDFQVNQKVRIKTFEEIKKTLITKGDLEEMLGYHSCHLGFNKDMLPDCGKETKIKKINENDCQLLDINYYWHKDWLELPGEAKTNPSSTLVSVISKHWS